MITQKTPKRALSRVLPGAVLALLILGACASNVEYARDMEAYYQEQCGPLSEGLNTAYEACRDQLIEKREAWLAKIDSKSFKRYELTPARL